MGMGGVSSLHVRQGKVALGYVLAILHCPNSAPILVRENLRQEPAPYRALVAACAPHYSTLYDMNMHNLQVR